HRNDMDDLRLRCKPVGIEVVGRPEKVFVHAVEAEAKEMLSLLRRAPEVPAGRLVGVGEGWQARNSYDVPVLIDGSGLSQLGHPRDCDDRGMWQPTVGKASMPRARLSVVRFSLKGQLRSALDGPNSLPTVLRR